MVWLRIKGDGITNALVTVLVAGAALLTVALPVTRKVIRPLAKNAVRTAKKFTNNMHLWTNSAAAEWKGIIREAQAESQREPVMRNSAIAQAWDETPDY